MIKAMAILDGKRILITGGGRGIGRAIAHICAQEGAKVAICSRNKKDLEETITTSSVGIDNDIKMEMHVVDVKQEDQVEAMVKSIVKRWGGIDVLINNAGMNQATKGPAHELESGDLKDVLDLNIVSVHTVTSAVLQHSMLEQGGAGRIINISSKAGKIGIPGMSFYVASKFALEGYSASLAEELKDKGIVVNTISPGMVNTASFPKAPGKKGVRAPESVRDGIMMLLETEKTGHYVHVDELDHVREKCLEKSLALKPINEANFKI